MKQHKAAPRHRADRELLGRYLLAILGGLVVAVAGLLAIWHGFGFDGSHARPSFADGAVAALPLVMATERAPRATRGFERQPANQPSSEKPTPLPSVTVKHTHKPKPKPVVHKPKPAKHTVAAGSKGETALAFAKAQLGEPYVFAADGPNSWDCSGLTLMAWAQVGVHLPHSAHLQYNVTPTKVSRSELRLGDLVFFYSGRTHVGIYAGNDTVIAAPHPGEVVKYSPISWMPFNGAVRPG